MKILSHQFFLKIFELLDPKAIHIREKWRKAQEDIIERLKLFVNNIRVRSEKTKNYIK